MNDKDNRTITTQGRGGDGACAETGDDLDIDRLHVVELRFDGEVLTLDGTPVDYGWQPPHELAVRAVALGIARPRGEAVRAFAEDETGTASELLIRPDGSSTVIQTCEELSPGDRLPSAAEAALARLAVKRANPWLVGPLEEAAPAAAPRRKPATTVRSALAGLRLRDRRPVRLVVAAIILSATVVATVAATLAGVGGDETTAPVSSAPTTTPAAPMPIAERSVVSAAPRTLQVTAAGGVTSLELTITASRLPVAAVVVVDPAGPGAPVRQTVIVRTPRTVVTVRGLAAGPASWHVSVPDAPPVQGKAPVEAEEPEPTFEPEPSQAPTPKKTPLPPPPGPTAPYDPDDHL